MGSINKTTDFDKLRYFGIINMFFFDNIDSLLLMN